jgi:apolipoprotein D and lipocalin family protein
MKHLLSLLCCLLLTGCLGMPETVSPVEGFQLDRYLGTWYEIARLDHSFERGLERVTATYALRDDGGVSVTNRGYSKEDAQWEVAEGKAYFVDDESKGHLKVSFFGPFYSSYVIFGLDKKNYDYAFISGPNHSYLWLLSRSPDLDREVIDYFVKTAQRKGFDTEKLIFVKHDADS